MNIIKQWTETSSITTALFVWSLSIPMLVLSLISTVDIAFIPGASRIGKYPAKGKAGLKCVPTAEGLFNTNDSFRTWISH